MLTAATSAGSLATLAECRLGVRPRGSRRLGRYFGGTASLVVPAGTVRSRMDAFGLFTGTAGICVEQRAARQSPTATTGSSPREADVRDRP